MTVEHSLVLPRNASAPCRARRLLSESALRLDSGRAHTAALLLSELVTNAVRHGAGQIRLEIEQFPNGRARITVSDDGAGTPVIRDVPDASGGWGLRLLAKLARDWGVHPDRTEIWFTV